MNNQMMTRTVLGLLLIGLLFAGCGPKGRGLRVEFVEGLITLDGQPLADAAITFHAKNPESSEVTAAGVSNQRGLYRLSSTDSNPEAGTTVGEYIVTVSKVDVYSPIANMSSEEAANARPGSLDSIHTHVLHEIYRDLERTPLSATVKKGRNRINFELKSNP